MTPIVCCGFECASSGHIQILSTAAFSTAVVRTGARSLVCNPTASNGYVQIIPDYWPTSPAPSTVVARVYLYFSTLPSADTMLIHGVAFLTTDRRPGLHYQASDGKVYGGFDDGTTRTLSASGFTVTTGQWYLVDLAISVAANPWTVDCRINGTALPQTTLALAADAVDAFRLGNTSARNCTMVTYYDDLIVSTTSADYPLGAGYVNHFVPTSDGTHNIAGTGDFQRGNTGTDILSDTTTAYQLVDDVPLPSGTVNEADNWRAVAPLNSTDYVVSKFGPAPGVSTPTVPPRAVDAICAYHQVATQTGSMDVLLDDNSATGTILSISAASGVTSYRYASAQFATPPSGGSWVIGGLSGNFNNLRVRFRSADAAPDQCLDAVMIEAEFASVTRSLPPPLQRPTYRTVMKRRG